MNPTTVYGLHNPLDPDTIDFSIKEDNEQEKIIIQYEEENKKDESEVKGAKKRAPYVYAVQMSFLEDTIQHRATDSSMNDDQVEHSQALDKEFEMNEGAQTSNALNENNITGQALQQSHATTSSNLSVNLTEKVVIGKKRKIPLIEAKLIEALDANAKRRETKENENDDDRLFLLSLLPQLKQLPPHLKLSARLSILQALNKFVLEIPYLCYLYHQPAPFHYRAPSTEHRAPPDPLHQQPLVYLQHSQHQTYLQATEKTPEYQQMQSNTATTEILPNETTSPLQSPSESIYSYYSITNDLNSSGFTTSVNAIQNKWKSLMRSYTKCKDNRNRTGQGPSRFLFYERIYDFVGDKPQNECSHSINSLEDSESDVTVENIEDEENIQPESINKNTEPGITENADGNMQEKHTNSQGHHKKRLSEKQIKKEYFKIKKEEYKKKAN
ncbi:unnamed protein product [Psylliodes chrysocephalus]|uniref:BESS domain-containing protein n=1 Tax=Psylliodes chrysocephalus TaxID=3402493 RepID=A0A9P0CS36_9CUCU|nr:unnamed protein product [Psylliodes chrysocephala]